MNRQKLIETLTSDEGLRLTVYKCTAGKNTIGIGRNLDDVGISMTEATTLLNNDIDKVQAALNDRLDWWTGLSENRQNVLANMAFQLGVNGLLKFKNTIAFIKAGAYDKAADGMLKSLWARQTPIRAKRLAKEMRVG